MIPHWASCILRQTLASGAKDPGNSGAKTKRNRHSSWGAANGDGQEQAIGGALVAWRTTIPFKGWCRQILFYTKHATV